MRQLLLIIATMAIGIGIGNAQDVTLESLKSMKADKEAAMATIADEIKALDDQILTFPGWKFGGVGSVGFNGIRNNDWFTLPTPNSSNAQLNLGLRAFARQDADKHFWDNGLKINLQRTNAFLDKDDDNSQSIALTNNALELNSIFGYKLRPKWALSAELNWLSTVLERGDTDLDYSLGFNAPGTATFSAGVTWLPITNLKVNIHPLGYTKNWPGALASMAGCKIGATYTAEVLPNVMWDSNLSAFLPYSGKDMVAHAYTNAMGVASTQNVMYSTGDYSRWQWINTFTTKIWKGIGVVAELGLAGNKQIADLSRIQASDTGTVDVSDNPLQSYYSLGLGYTF